MGSGDNKDISRRFAGLQRGFLINPNGDENPHSQTLASIVMGKEQASPVKGGSLVAGKGERGGSGGGEECFDHGPSRVYERLQPIHANKRRKAGGRKPKRRRRESNRKARLIVSGVRDGYPFKRRGGGMAVNCGV